MVRTFLATFVMSALLGGTAAGQVTRGLTEVGAFGTLTSVNARGNTESVLLLAAGVGRFFTESVEVNVSAGITKVGDLDATGSIGSSVVQHFATSMPIVPFVSLDAAIGLGSFGSYEGTPFIVGGSGGVKLFTGLSSGAAVVIRPFYFRQTFDNVGVNNYGVTFGISAFVGR